MKNDFVTIFNQLTSSKLADYSLFSDMIENHYEKFKFLYYLIEDIDLDNIDNIYSKASKKELKTFIIPKSVKCSNSIIFDINSKKQEYSLSSFFNINLTEEHDKLVVSIRIVDDKKEGEIYENRFVWYVWIY